MSRRNWTRAIVALGISLVSAPAIGQTGDAPASEDAGEPVLLDSNEEHADALHRKAKERMDAGDNEGAHELLVEAYRLKPTYDIAANLGTVLLRLNRHPEAAQLLDEARKKLPTDGVPEAARQQLSSQLDEARAKSGIMNVHTSQEGIAVLVDGVERAQLKANEDNILFVAPGEHRVELSLRGAKSEGQVVDLQPGVGQTLQFGPIEPGSSSQPGNGAEGGEGDQTGAIVTTVVMGVAGLGLLAAGGGMFAVASGQEDDALALEQQPGCSVETCEDVRQAFADKDASQNTGVGLLVAGGALTAATIITAAVLFSGTDEEPASSIQIHPLIGPQTAGIGVLGSF